MSDEVLKEYEDMFRAVEAGSEEANSVAEYEALFRGESPSTFEEGKSISQMANEYAYGFASGTSITESLGNIAETHVTPLGRLEIDTDKLEEKGLEGWKFALSPLAYMIGRINYVPPSEEFMAQYNQGNTDAAMAQLQKEKTSRVEQRWMGEDIDRESIPTVVGEISSMFVDPTSVMPLARLSKIKDIPKVVNGVKTGSVLPVMGYRVGESAAGGAALAAAEVGLAQYSGAGISEPGTVNWDDVGLAAALGAIGTGVVAKLGNKFRTRAVEKIARGEKLKTDDLLMAPKEIRDEVFENEQEFLDSLNRKLGLEEPTFNENDLGWVGKSKSEVIKAKNARKKKAAKKTEPFVYRDYGGDVATSEITFPGPRTTNVQKLGEQVAARGDMSIRPTEHTFTHTFRGVTSSYLDGDSMTDALSAIARAKELSGKYVPVHVTDDIVPKIKTLNPKDTQKMVQEDLMWYQHINSRAANKAIQEQKVWRARHLENAAPSPDRFDNAMTAAFDRLAASKMTTIDGLKHQLRHSMPEGNTIPSVHDAGSLKPALRNPYTNKVMEALSEDETVNQILARAVEKDPNNWRGLTARDIDLTENVGYVGKSGAFYHPEEARSIMKSVVDRLPEEVAEEAGPDVLQGMARPNSAGALALANNRQLGAVSAQLSATMAGAGVGGLVGYAWDPDMGGATLGMLAGGALGAGSTGAIPNMVRALRHKSNPFKWAESVTAAWIISSPRAVLNKMGTMGQKLAYNIGIARDNMETTISGKLADAEVVFGKLGVLNKAGQFSKENGETIMRLLQREISPGAVPKPLAQAAEHIRGLFDQTVKDAIKAKIIDPKQGAKLLKNSKTKGYWPRIYNDMFLSTDAGEKLWLETLGKEVMDETTAKDILETIMGEHHSSLGDVLNSIVLKDAKGNFVRNKAGNLQYKFTPSSAKALLNQRRRYVASGRSVHMEKSRKLHVKSEEILKPFLISDPYEVMSEYFSDVYKQIEFAKVFGAKDEEALALFGDIDKMYGTKAQRLAAETYWAAVGDPRSYSIKQTMEMDEGVRAMFQKADAITTLNLAMAQVLNSIQATVNGSIMLANYSANPLRFGKLAFDSWMDVDKNQVLPSFLHWKALGGTEHGRAVAKRSGASFETGILQYIGEHSNMQHTILGKNFKGGMYNPVNWINNPTTFLRATGFLAVERFQRDLAANMGYHAAVDILERKAAALQKGDTALINKLDKHLTELGISTGDDPLQIIQKSMEGNSSQLLRAGLRFSNEVNFRNVAETMPLLAQSPYAKIFRKFKTFAFHQGKFLKDHVGKPALEGNFAPLLTWASMAWGVGAPVADFREMLKGATDEEKETILDRLFKGVANIGAAGLFWDTLSSTAYGKDKPWAAFGGPAISHASSLLHGSYKALANKDSYDFWKAAINTQVFPGKDYVKEKYFNKKKRRRKSSDDYMKLLTGGSTDYIELLQGRR